MDILEILSLFAFLVAIYLYTNAIEDVFKNKELNILKYIVSFCLALGASCIFIDGGLFVGCYTLIAMFFFMFFATYLSDKVEKRDN